MQGPLGYGAYPLQPPVRRKKKKKKVKRQRRPESELPPGLLPPVVERPSAMASSRAVNLPPPELTGAKVEVVAPKKTDTNPEVNVRQLAQTALTKNMQLGNHVNFAASPRGRQDREKLHKTLAICGAVALVLVLGIIAFRGYSAGPFDRPGGAAYLEAQNLYSRIDSMMEGNANQSEWNELYSEHESVMGKLSPALESLAAKRTDLAAELSACHGESLKAVVNAKTPGERAEAQASLQTHLGNARKLFEKG